jgi:NAD(P)-dependent dehydrogenase (short-subunit alcohol dehydrogenase family)
MSHPVAVVTGGYQGLGLAANYALASRNFNIAFIDIHPSNDITQEIIKKLQTFGVKAKYYQLDIADVSSHSDVLSAIEKDFGAIHCLLNNAGIAARPLKDILEIDEAAFDLSMSVNLRGTFFLSQAVARRMIAQGKSSHYRSIIFITSIAAQLVSTDRAQYNISKAALSMVAANLAVRLGSEGIAVHEIRPGFIKTAMTASAGSEIIDAWIADGRVPIPRWGEPEDVGKAVAALASGDIPYMTGQPLWIAGGLNIPQAT